MPMVPIICVVWWELNSALCGLYTYLNLAPSMAYNTLTSTAPNVAYTLTSIAPSVAYNTLTSIASSVAYTLTR